MKPRLCSVLSVALSAVLAMAALHCPLAAAAPAPIALAVDLRDAPRKIIHATVTIPVQAGPLTLAYPKWIPSEHALAPIEQQAGLFITGGGQAIRWQRDPLDVYLYHLVVPPGVQTIE